MNTPLSKSAVKRAGSMIRKYGKGECELKELDPHLDVMRHYRASFNPALEATHEALVSLHGELGIRGEITRRLKKTRTILEKLIRESGLDLSRMQDIGGCRSVLDDLDDLYRVRDGIAARWEAKEVDYISSPRQSGYRAIHMIVRHEDRPIEIQLRTKTMHSWAEMVEALSMTLAVNYKQDGDAVVQQYMRAMSELMAATEAGGFPTSASLAILDRLRPEVMTLIEASNTEAKEEKP